MAPASEAETQVEAEERQRNYKQQRKEYEQEQERKTEERKQQFEREQKEHEAERARGEKLHKARVSKFDRILDKAPAMFSAAQLRVFLRALVTIDPYAFDDVAEHLAANDDNNEQSSEEILLSTIDGLPDDKLTGFALRLVLTAHTPIPRESEIDFLTEAEAALAPSEPKKTANKKSKTPTPIKSAQKTTAAKKTKAKKQAAA
jgi:ParB family chromosome partitioning protein